jgi:hypothetical protein
MPLSGDRKGREPAWSRAKYVLTAAVLVLAFASTACGDEGSERDATATAPLPVDGKAFPIDPGEFTTAIDNPYWPMKPGSGASIISTDALAKVLYGHFEHGSRRATSAESSPT